MCSSACFGFEFECFLNKGSHLSSTPHRRLQPFAIILFFLPEKTNRSPPDAHIFRDRMTTCENSQALFTKGISAAKRPAIINMILGYISSKAKYIINRALWRMGVITENFTLKNERFYVPFNLHSSVRRFCNKIHLPQCLKLSNYIIYRHSL